MLGPGVSKFSETVTRAEGIEREPHREDFEGYREAAFEGLESLVETGDD